MDPSSLRSTPPIEQEEDEWGMLFLFQFHLFLLIYSGAKNIEGKKRDLLCLFCVSPFFWFLFGITGLNRSLIDLLMGFKLLLEMRGSFIALLYPD